MRKVKFIQPWYWANKGEVKVLDNWMARTLAARGVVEIIEELPDYNSPEAILVRRLDKVIDIIKRSKPKLSVEERIRLLKSMKKALGIKEKV